MRVDSNWTLMTVSRGWTCMSVDSNWTLMTVSRGWTCMRVTCMMVVMYEGGQ